ncbi:MAG: S8/S53 family peptidase [Balneolales bacterium]
MKFITVLWFACAFLCTSADAQNRPEYLPGKLVIKFEKEQALTQKARTLGTHPRDQVRDYMRAHGVDRFQPVFRESAQDVVGKVLSRRNRQKPAGRVAADLARTFYVNYASNMDPKLLAAKLSMMPGVVYAEPHYTFTLQEEPNDPLFGTEGQDYFEYQKFVDAWEVSQSSTSVVIAIVDSGVFYNHPDLVNKLHRIEEQPSPASQVFDEIADDTIGWDFWESGDVFAGEVPVQDNDPIARWSIHGTHVAGIAAAETNNGIGIAGTGYKATYMPVKVGGTENYPGDVPFGLEGILYAALNGADIINCSFGTPNFSEFGQDVVNIATEMGALVVASAGNDGADLPLYPASYQNALSVGSVRSMLNDEGDQRSIFSTYGYSVDVFATGENIRSTTFEYDNIEETWTVEPDSIGYMTATGTSMSAPVVSGLAALIKDQNPDWSSRRLAFQIRNTARSIDASHGAEYNYKLGRGVINSFSAVTDHTPALEIVDIRFINEQGNSLNVGDDGFAEITVVNHGEPTSPFVTISSLIDNVTIHSGSVNIGFIDTGDSLTLELGITLDEDYDLTKTPLFNIQFEEQNAGYDDFSIQEYEDLLFENIQTPGLTMSFSNDGTIGFRDPLNGDEGVGFIPAGGDNQLFDAGLMIHAQIGDTTHVPNQVRAQSSVNRDFTPVRNIGIRDPELADLEYSAAFNSTRHPVIDGLNVEMEVYAILDEGVDQTMFVRYTVTNTSDTTYSDVHIGLFNDWDVGDVVTNSVGFSEPDSLIYVYDEMDADQPLISVAHMGSISSAFAIDNTSEISLAQAETREDSLGFGIYYDPSSPAVDGFTTAEKKLALTSGFEKTTAGNTDISVVTGTGPFVLETGGAVSVGFIYAYGSDLDDLREQVHNARSRDLFEVSPIGTYRDVNGVEQIPEITQLFQNYPNPFRGSTNIQYDLAEAGHIELSVYNVLGQRVTTLVNGIQSEGRQTETFNTRNLSSGLYLVVLRTENDDRYTIKMTLVK